MSHRGGSLERIENTLTAFKYSADTLKVHLLELDVQLTKDNQVVIFHDRNLLRLCGVNKTISDFNFEDLPRLLIPEKLKKTVSDFSEDPDHNRIPLLEELFKLYPLYPMQIDVKLGQEELVLQTGNLIRKYNRQKFTVWGSFKDNANARCQKGIGLKELYKKYFKPVYSCLILPNIKFFMNRGYFQFLNSMGISVIAFGVGIGAINNEEGYAMAREAGVNGICTDRPSLLMEWLKSHPLNGVDGNVVQSGKLE
ncbi:hypothetical protein HDU92_007651 [Lobulomyces angularis]|nr:hypothetical protein HDU92_007651 [Lobulomyces angularis]